MIRDILKHIGGLVTDVIKHFGELLGAFLRQPEGWFLLIFFATTFGFLASSISLPQAGAARLWSLLLSFLTWVWPIIAFIILWPITRDMWINIRQIFFKRDIRFILLELKIPLTVTESPKSMEQVLSAIHSLGNYAGNISEIYYEGEVTRWYSLEIASFGGGTRYFIRLYAQQKGLIESAFFAYYPSVELVEVDDYAQNIPNSVTEVYANECDLWGAQMLLEKEDAYPIKTYMAFENPEEEKWIDPMASFLEVMAKLKPGEFVGIQIILQPVRNWHVKWQPLVEELRTPKEKTDAGVEEGYSISFRTPGETEVLKSVELNLSKIAFKTVVRFLYISPGATFYDSFARRGLAGAFNQYKALNLNGFRIDYIHSGTRTKFLEYPHFFWKTRGEYRKQRLLYNYINRVIGEEKWVGRYLNAYMFSSGFVKDFVMNTEGIASLFHPPTQTVLTAPHIERVEAKRMAPPAGLPIYGDDSALENFVQ